MKYLLAISVLSLAFAFEAKADCVNGTCSVRSTRLVRTRAVSRPVRVRFFFFR